MPFDSILQEADRLNGVSTRLEGLADQNPTMTEGLLTIAANVRSAATLLALLVKTKRPKD